jgi:hypothetical protein
MVMTSGSPLNRLFEKVRDLIPIPPQKEREEKRKKDESPVKLAENDPKDYSKCSHRFGYLAKLSKKASIPEECLTCQKLLECKNN